MKAGLTLCVAVAATWAVGCQRQSTEAPIAVGANGCVDNCVVNFDTLAVLGANYGPVYPDPSAVAIQTADGGFLVAPTDQPGAVAVYDSDGRLVGTFGRAGHGPGEYDLAFMQFYRGPGDTISILDAFQLRRTIIDEKGRVLRSHPLPSPHTGYFELKGRAYFQATIRTRDGSRLIHRLDSIGAVSESFVVPQPGEERAEAYRARASTDTGIWLAERTRYAAEFYNEDLERTHILTVNTEWFRPHGTEPARSHAERPKPQIVGLNQDSADRLWFLIIVADSNWRAPERQEGARVTATAMAAVYDWVLEAVDPGSGARLASIRSDRPLAFGNGDGVVYALSEGRDGQGVLTAIRPRLR